MTVTLTHLINGATVSGDVSAESINPSNLDEVVARYPKGGAAEVNDAVKAARAAFPGWSEASPEVRSDVLDKAGSLIMGRAKDLGALLSREEGKTLPEGTGEVMRAARILKYFAGEALRRQGLLDGVWCLDPDEVLSPGQADEITRVERSYPEVTDAGQPDGLTA